MAVPVPAQGLMLTLLASAVLAMASGNPAEAALGLGLLVTGALAANSRGPHSSPPKGALTPPRASPLDVNRDLARALDGLTGSMTGPDLGQLRGQLERFVDAYHRTLAAPAARLPDYRSLEDLRQLRAEILDACRAHQVGRRTRVGVDMAAFESGFRDASHRMLRTAAAHCGLPSRSSMGRPAPWDERYGVWGEDRYLAN